jgi:catechol 2,3-dioxygenase-like lactoylglutathione lyase family enzyme
MEDPRQFIKDSGGLFDCRPILCVDSVTRSIDFYVNSLGFRLGWSWSGLEQRFLQPGDNAEPDFALVGRGHVQFMLSQQSQGAPGMWLHLDVQTAHQLDALHDEWTGTGAMIHEPPSVRSWGMYELRLRDPDGHTLRVSAPPPTTA